MKYFFLAATTAILSWVTQFTWPNMAQSNDSDFHDKELKRHCRVCARVITENQYAYTCQEQKSKRLLVKIGVNVDHDQPNVQPTIFCQSCHWKATQYSESVDSALEIFKWTPHTDPSSSCTVCCLFRMQNRGGRPKKERKNRGRPRSGTVSNILSNAPRSWKHPLPCYSLVSCRRQQLLHFMICSAAYAVALLTSQ